jgi:hypothetical protein
VAAIALIVLLGRGPGLGPDGDYLYDLAKPPTSKVVTGKVVDSALFIDGRGAIVVAQPTRGAWYPVESNRGSMFALKYRYEGDHANLGQFLDCWPAESYPFPLS